MIIGTRKSETICALFNTEDVRAGWTKHQHVSTTFERNRYFWNTTLGKITSFSEHVYSLVFLSSVTIILRQDYAKANKSLEN